MLSLKQHYDWLKKKGIVEVTFNIIRHPDDKEFDLDNPPVACVFVYTGSTNHEVRKTYAYKGMIPCDHPLEIEIKTIADSVTELATENKSVGGKEVTFHIIPHSGWEIYYKSMEVKRYYKPGKYTENISFIPEKTQSNSTCNKTVRRVVSRNNNENT